MESRLNPEYIQIKNKHQLDALVDNCKFPRSKHAVIIRDLIARWGGPVPPQEWFDLAVEALFKNEHTRGGVWKQYARTGKISFTDVCGCIRGFLRHERTDYNELLGWGLTREKARFRMKSQDEKVEQ